MKHVLNTSTDTLQFTDNFYDYFMVEDGFRVRLREDNELIDNYELLINAYAIKRDQDIKDLSDNEYIHEFKIYDKESNTLIDIEEEKQNKIYFASNLFKWIVSKRRNKEIDGDGFIHIPFTNLEIEDDVFYATLENAEITKSIKELKGLIEKGSEIEGVKDISDLINRLNKLFKSGGVHAESVHIEILARNIIRDRKHITELPDYSIKNPDYIITSIHNSILNNPSVITSLSFERIHQQLSSATTYKKTGTSPLDRLYVLE